MASVWFALNVSYSRKTLSFQITPKYKHHEWITGTELLGKVKAPGMKYCCHLKQSSRRDGKFSQQSSAKVRNSLILLHELALICYFSFISWKSGRFQMSALFLLRNKKVHCWFDNKNFFWSWYVRGECFVCNFCMEINVWLFLVLINHCLI